MAARRDVLRMIGAGGLAAAVGGGLGARRAFALEASEAESFVRATIDEVLALVRSSGDEAAKAGEFRRILEERGAMPQIARFAAGKLWREMSPAQQDRFVDAFTRYVSKVYSRRFSEYSGQTVSLGRAEDQGKRGILVNSTVEDRNGQPVDVDWLVSDRPGKTVIADIVIEGVSMLITQRDEVAGIYASNGRDADKMIEFLASV